MLSQTKKKVFFGKIIDSTVVVKDAHIVNLTTKKGTFSDEKGFFNISAKENDRIQISSIGYKTKIFTLKNYQFNGKINFINLEKDTYILDEIVLKNHHLTGSLLVDIKKIPIDKKKALVTKMVSDIKKMNVYEISKMPISNKEAHLVAADIVKLPNNFEGFGVKFGNGKKNKKKTSLIEKLEENVTIENKILNELGSHFFFTELKIPKNKYHHFFTYCSYKGIVELYKKNELLKIIQIFKKESIQYLEDTKKNK